MQVPIIDLTIQKGVLQHFNTLKSTLNENNFSIICTYFWSDQRMNHSSSQSSFTPRNRKFCYRMKVLFYRTKVISQNKFFQEKRWIRIQSSNVNWDFLMEIQIFAQNSHFNWFFSQKCKINPYGFLIISKNILEYFWIFYKNNKGKIYF